MTSSTTNHYCGASYAEQSINNAPTQRVPFVHLGGDLELRWTTTLDGNAFDESWGLREH